jgi:hypothetical protein
LSQTATADAAANNARVNSTVKTVTSALQFTESSIASRQWNHSNGDLAVVFWTRRPPFLQRPVNVDGRNVARCHWRRAGSEKSKPHKDTIDSVRKPLANAGVALPENVADLPREADERRH